MEVSTRKTGDLQAVMTVNLKEDDYREKVDKQLKDYRKKANIPGFRKGHVPMSLVKKQYGKAVLIEEVNHILQHAIFDHIKEENLDILGNPVPVEQTDIDWNAQKEFSFEYELGLAPDFDLKVSDKVKVPFYKITADKEMVDRYVEDYARRYGKMSYPEKVEDKCIVKAEFIEVDKKDELVENGLSESATFTIESLDDKKSIKELMGKTKGDELVLDSKKAFKKDFNLANLLGIEEAKLEATTQRFKLKLTEISKLEPAELNQELFDKIFGEGAVSSEKEFRNRIKEDAEKSFVTHSNQQFYVDAKSKLLDKMKFDLPEEFLKKWMQNAGEKPLSKEEAETQFPDMKEEMRWQLIENKVIKEHNIKVNNDELLDFTKQLVARQMAQYGQMPEELDLESIAKNVIQNKEEEQRITDQLYSEKLINFFKENLKLDEKEVTVEEFRKKVEG